MSVSMMAQAPAAPWWKQRWPWLLMLGPAVVVVAGSYTGYLAWSQQDALVVGDYYKQGKAINQDLRRDRLASTLGLSMSLGYDATTGTLNGQLRRHSSDQGRSERLFVHLSHATLPEKDIQLVVQPDEFGAFQINLPMLERSRWVVLVEGEKRDWRLAGAWTWPAQRQVTLQADE
ncbi:putative FixH family protein [Janthinobacterium sp. HH01]|uniref:FixH family protein n=1 Tax=Janthinobacterium sp. HH01 TaxID=1198452 RepID=UPI0002AE8F7F|nr:FixH family protein [Janthinobacterium sp. HH01]ELX11626.1 putative FixH family protein [Janthinobacterium sp. HH01]